MGFDEIFPRDPSDVSIPWAIPCDFAWYQFDTVGSRGISDGIAYNRLVNSMQTSMGYSTRHFIAKFH